MRAALAALTLAWALSGADLLDRIAVIAGDEVITESEVLRELRVTAFLNGDPVPQSAEVKRRAAERLVEQQLIRNEMQLAAYSEPDLSEADKLLAPLKQERFGGKEEAYQRALDQYAITEDDVEAQLLRQFATLQFTELRFRPGVIVSDEEIRKYYEEHAGPQSGKSLDEVREQIEEKLAAGRVDEQLDAWLKEARGHTRIEFRDEVFQ